MVVQEIIQGGLTEQAFEGFFFWAMGGIKVFMRKVLRTDFWESGSWSTFLYGTTTGSSVLFALCVCSG